MTKKTTKEEKPKNEDQNTEEKKGTQYVQPGFAANYDCPHCSKPNDNRKLAGKSGITLTQCPLCNQHFVIKWEKAIKVTILTISE